MAIKLKKLRLRASEKDNRRYLLIKEKDNEKIERAILDYIGILGFAKSAYMRVKFFSGGIVGAVRRESLNDVRAALSLAGISVERVSGTLKGLKC
jgi:RNase P/RNase MRP subunit POP5